MYLCTIPLEQISKNNGLRELKLLILAKDIKEIQLWDTEESVISRSVHKPGGGFDIGSIYYSCRWIYLHRHCQRYNRETNVCLSQEVCRQDADERRRTVPEQEVISIYNPSFFLFTEKTCCLGLSVPEQSVCFHTHLWQNVKRNIVTPRFFFLFAHLSLNDCVNLKREKRLLFLFQATKENIIIWGTSKFSQPSTRICSVTVFFISAVDSGYMSSYVSWSIQSLFQFHVFISQIACEIRWKRNRCEVHLCLTGIATVTKQSIDSIFFSVLAGTLHEDDTNSFQKTTARDHSTDDGRTGTCSAERGAHKALRGPSGRGLRGEMNLTNHRPSPGDISSTRHWSPGWPDSWTAASSIWNLIGPRSTGRNGGEAVLNLQLSWVVRWSPEAFSNYPYVCQAGGRGMECGSEAGVGMEGLKRTP